MIKWPMTDEREIAVQTFCAEFLSRELGSGLIKYSRFESPQTANPVEFKSCLFYWYC